MHLKIRLNMVVRGLTALVLFLFSQSLYAVTCNAVNFRDEAQNPATIGDGNCVSSGGSDTLRAAVEEINDSPGPHTINLSTGTYTLSINGTGEDAAATG